jgi:type III secretion system FlhB-like substrate exporter
LKERERERERETIQKEEGKRKAPRVSANKKGKSIF